MMQRGYFPYIFCRYNQLDGKLNVISEEKKEERLLGLLVFNVVDSGTIKRGREQ